MPVRTPTSGVLSTWVVWGLHPLNPSPTGLYLIYAQVAGLFPLLASFVSYGGRRRQTLVSLLKPDHIRSPPSIVLTERTVASPVFITSQFFRSVNERLLHKPLQFSVRDVTSTWLVPYLARMEFLMASVLYFAFLVACARSRSMESVTTCASITRVLSPFVATTSGTCKVPLGSLILGVVSTSQLLFRRFRSIYFDKLSCLLIVAHVFSGIAAGRGWLFQM